MSKEQKIKSTGLRRQRKHFVSYLLLLLLQLLFTVIFHMLAQRARICIALGTAWYLAGVWFLVWRIKDAVIYQSDSEVPFLIMLKQ